MAQSESQLSTHPNSIERMFLEAHTPQELVQYILVQQEKIAELERLVNQLMTEAEEDDWQA